MSGNATGIRAAKAFVEMYVNDVGIQKGLKKAEAQLRAFQARVGKIGGGLFAAGSAMALPLGFGTKEFATFEQSMARVSTMLEEPQKYMDGFSAGVKRMATESGKNINELADGLKEILSASVAPESALGMLNNANRMAVAADTTIGQSVFTLIGIMNSYGMTAEETGRISDILFESVKWGTMTVAGLSDAIGTVAPMANAAGMELEDLMAVMSTLTRAGLSADEAGVRVNAMLKQMPREMKNALNVAKQFQGMELADINKMIPEIRAAQGFAILGNNVAGLQRDMMMIRDSGGATDQAFKKMANTLMQWFNRLREAMRQVAIAAGEALGPGLKKYGDAAINALRGLATVIDNNRGALVKFAKVTAGILAVGAALLFVAKAAALLLVVSEIAQLFYTRWTLVAAAVVAGLYYMTDGFTELRRISEDAMSGVKAALAGGDAILAVKIFWTSVKLAWSEGIAWVESKWNAAVTAMAKTDNFVYFLTSQYGIVGELRKMWWGAVRDIKDALASVAIGAAKLALLTPQGQIAGMLHPGDERKALDDALAASATKNLADMQSKQSAFDAERLEAVEKLKQANGALDNSVSDQAKARRTEMLLLQAEMRGLIIDANKVKTVQASKPGAGQGYPSAGGPNTAAIARQIAEARIAFGVGRSFGWGAGGANSKSRELEVAEESRTFLKKIETNTRNSGIIVGV